MPRLPPNFVPVIAAAMIVVPVSAGTQGQSQPPQEALVLEVLEARVLAQHPAIRAASARVEEARGRVIQAGAWFNPVAGFTSDELRPRVSPSGFLGGFMQQTIPLGGKLSAAESEALREVQRREEVLATTRQRVLMTVRSRYYEVLAAEERLTVTERLAKLADEAVEISRQLFNVGAADRPDVLEGEAQAQRGRVHLAEAQNRRQAAWRRLAAAAADEALTPRALTTSISAALPDLDGQSTLDRVLRESPELRAAASQVERERSGIEVQRRLTRPDLFLRGEAGWNREHIEPVTRGRSIGWQFGVEAGLSLPLFNQNRGGIAGAAAATSAAEAAHAQLRLDVQARFATAFEEYDSARVAVATYRAEILPRAQQAYELYLEKYRQMAAAYPQVLIAQRNLFEMTEQYVNAVERVWRAALRLQGFVIEAGD